MLITRETDYALRIIRALSEGEKKATVISESELVPQQFIYKILKKLEKANIIEVKRGVKGGCKLIADLKTLTIYSIMNVMGDELAVNNCTDSKYKCSWECKDDRKCSLRTNMLRIQSKIRNELSNTTLEAIFR